MKPTDLNRQLECDDGIFNINWTQDRRIRPVECEWKVLGGAGEACGKISKIDPITEIIGNYWCVDCGMVVCLKHRKDHVNGTHHARRLAHYAEQQAK